MLQCSCNEFHSNPPIQTIAQRYNLQISDAQVWFDAVQITALNEISEATLESVLHALRMADLITEKQANTHLKFFIDNRICQLSVDIRSMNLYEREEILICLFNNLNYIGKASGSLSYKDLLPYDQNSYDGTKKLDLFVEKAGLKNGNSVINIGSSLGMLTHYKGFFQSQR